MPLYNSFSLQSWEPTSNHLLTDDSNKYVAKSGGKIIVDVNKDITITLPKVSSGEVELFNISSNNKVYIDLQGEKYNKNNYLPSDLIFEGSNNYIKIVYLNKDIGWFPLFGKFHFITSSYPPGMALWLEGELIDKSTFKRKIISIGSKTPDMATGLDFKPVLRWDGTRSQELRIPTFLQNTDGVTLYAVFTANAFDSYTIVKTISGNDNWYHAADGNGDFGTFQNVPLTGYPEDMPASGSHLVSIHASSDTYEVLLNNTSKGLRPGSYNPGTLFGIGSRSRPFSGDIALILVYPGYLSPESFFHRNCINQIKSFYPSLPFTID